MISPCYVAIRARNRRIAELEAENAELKASLKETEEAWQVRADLNAELRKDKERLDWLEDHSLVSWMNKSYSYQQPDGIPTPTFATARAAIDAAMEAK